MNGSLAKLRMIPVLGDPARDLADLRGPRGAEILTSAGARLLFGAKKRAEDRHPRSSSTLSHGSVGYTRLIGRRSEEDGTL